MIKAVTQYVVVCDNAFCDSILRSGVDHHSFDRREQFKRKVENQGWDGMNNNSPNSRHICPNCREIIEENLTQSTIHENFAQK